MAGIGLSKPYVAVYTNTGGVVTYGTPQVAGKAVSLELSLDNAGDNVLYGDNGPAESENLFAGGSITLGTTDLSPAVFSLIYGVSPEAIGTSSDSWYKNNDSQVTPYVGLGAIRKKMVSGSIKYQAYFYRKVMFNNIAEAMETQGETIEWQTPEIEGNVYRDDTSTHDWRWISSLVDTEAEAEALLMAAFGQ